MERLTEYEKGLAICDALGLRVHERKMQAHEGLICNRTILIDPRLSEMRKAAVLAEELGHFMTSVGNIIDCRDANNSRQEAKARLWSYRRLIDPAKLAEAGVDERVIQQIVGHKGQNVTRQVYTHLTMKPLLEAINRI